MIQNCGMNAHCYADDSQTYISAPTSDAVNVINCFVHCVSNIERWMDSNRLKLNTNKTQIIWLGTRQQLAKINVNSFVLGPSTVHAVDGVVDLGVHIDTLQCVNMLLICASHAFFN